MFQVDAFSSSFRRNRVFLFGTVLVAILAAVVTALITAAHLHQQAHEHVAMEAQNLVRSIDQTLEGMVASVDIALLGAADEMTRQWANGAVDTATTRQFFDRQIKRLPHLSYLRATNARGDVVYGPGVLSPPNNVSDRPYFARLQDDTNRDLLVSQHLVGRIAGKWAWLFVRRVNQPNGSFGGVVFAGMLTEQFEAGFARFKLDSGGSVGLRDAEMGLIARFSTEMANQVPPGDKRLPPAMVAALQANPLEGTYDSGTSSLDGINRTHSFRRNTKYGFLTNVGIAGDAAMSAWRQQTALVIALTTAFGLSALAFVRVLVRSWRRQQQDLARALADQQALGESEERYHSLFATMSEGVALHELVCDAQGRPVDYRILEVNRAYSLLTGFTKEAVLGQLATQAYGLPRAPFLNRYARVAQTRQSLSFEESFEPLQKDFLIKVFSPKPGQFATVFEDITENKKLERALRDGEEFVTAVMDSMSAHIAVINTQGDILAVNAAWRRFAENNGAASLAEVAVGANYLKACKQTAPDQDTLEAAQALAGIQAVLCGEMAEFTLEYLCHSPISQRWFVLNALPLQTAKGGAVLIHQDVTERHRFERELQESEARYRVIAENVLDVIWILDLQTSRFTYVSPSVERLRGYSVAEILAQPVEMALTPESAVLVQARMQERLQQIAAGESTNSLELFEVSQPHRDGHIIHTEVVTSYLLDADGKPTQVLGVTRDISERKRLQAMQQVADQKLQDQMREILELQQRLQSQVVRDPLTGLYNRRYMDETLPRELALAKREGHPLALAMLDLDHFKRVNDTYGHAAGDDVLRKLATILINNARESDIVCRYGGEEFLVVLPRMGLEQALLRVEKWRQEIANATVKHGEFTITVTLSAGVACFPDHGADVDTLQARADEALYQAKDEGRNRVICSDATPS